MKKHILLLTLFTSIGLSAQNLNPVPSIINPGTADTFTGGYTFALQNFRYSMEWSLNKFWRLFK